MPEELNKIRGDLIPQHPLLSKAQWAYILSGRIRIFTYWPTLGPYHHPETQTINYPHAEDCVIIYRKDYLDV